MNILGMSFEEALNSVKITPKDVDIIKAHLHFGRSVFGHCGYANRCKNAQVFVQEEELKFAYSTHALFSGSCKLSYLKDVRRFL